MTSKIVSHISTFQQRLDDICSKFAGMFNILVERYFQHDFWVKLKFYLEVFSCVLLSNLCRLVAKQAVIRRLKRRIISCRRIAEYKVISFRCDKEQTTLCFYCMMWNIWCNNQTLNFSNRISLVTSNVNYRESSLNKICR